MRTARWIFLSAGIYGLLVLIPQYFLIQKVPPPAVTHQAYYYGFVGLAVAFQFLFLLVAKDPVRYRSLMLVAMLEKAVFFVPGFLLYAQGRMHRDLFLGAIMDAVLMVLFAIAWARTPKTAPSDSINLPS